MRKFINLVTRKVAGLIGTSNIKNIYEEIARIRSISEGISITEYLSKELYLHEKYKNSKRVTHYHSSVFTQNGEDGIIDEIFRRVGTTNKFFVEFGVHGVKNNSTFLLVKGWKGVWIGGNENGEKIAQFKFKQQMRNRDLIFEKNWITRDNIEELFAKTLVPSDFDYLSIDLDGNDYWIWEAIQRYRPRVVSVEYNATFPPEISWVMDYNANHNWDQTSYFGASLKALQLLGNKKGYELIGCDFTGCNAFFLRNDLPLDLFEKPFSSTNHYEPPRYFLKRPSGHPQSFGPFKTIE